MHSYIIWVTPCYGVVIPTIALRLHGLACQETYQALLAWLDPGSWASWCAHLLVMPSGSQQPVVATSSHLFADKSVAMMTQHVQGLQASQQQLQRQARLPRAAVIDGAVVWLPLPQPAQRRPAPQQPLLRRLLPQQQLTRKALPSLLQQLQPPLLSTVLSDSLATLSAGAMASLPRLGWQALALGPKRCLQAPGS